jgi:hypothetical protein
MQTESEISAEAKPEADEMDLAAGSTPRPMLRISRLLRLRSTPRPMLRPLTTRESMMLSSRMKVCLLLQRLLLSILTME